MIGLGERIGGERWGHLRKEWKGRQYFSRSDLTPNPHPTPSAGRRAGGLETVRALLAENNQKL